MLQQLGHTAITPIPSGLGTDQERLSADTTLSPNIKDVCNAVSGLEEVTLVGHSYAGMMLAVWRRLSRRKFSAWFSWTLLFPKTASAYWTCSRQKLALIFVRSRKAKVVAGVYRAGKASSTSWA